LEFKSAVVLFFSAMMGTRSSRHYSEIGVTKGTCAGLRAFARSAFAVVAISLLAVIDASASTTKSACESSPSPEVIETLRKSAPTLRTEVLRLALRGATCAAQQGLVQRKELLTVIDYSMPSTQPRLFVFDLAAKKLLFKELVAHGKNSGDNITRFFSNSEGSLATSMGLFVTANTYIGSNGYSLRLKGLDDGYNDKAWSRAIVMHGATYVSNAATRALGRLGRSWGCPAVRPEVAKKLIDTLKGGSPIFAYYPDMHYLKSSKFLRGLS
jgi:hypothetical protein